MNPSRIAAYLRKDGWLLAALALCVGLCLALGAGGSATETDESRITRVLSGIEGAGQVDIAVYYEEAVPCGAVLVAQGAGDVAVQLRLISAVSALLGVEPDRVAVYPREGGN